MDERIISASTAHSHQSKAEERKVENTKGTNSLDIQGDTKNLYKNRNKKKTIIIAKVPCVAEPWKGTLIDKFA